MGSFCPPLEQDGSFATTTWNRDSTVAEERTRDGLTLSYTYDAANRPLSVVPSGTVAPTLEPLDAGSATTWDALSRPTSQRKGDPSLTVAYPSYDLGSRPAAEKVGNREALGWAWDIYDQPIETRLPAGVGRSAGAFTGFERQFNSLDQSTSIGALGGEPQSVPLGANWTWGGSGRLWGMTTKGSLGTAVRFGYLGGAGAQPPAGNPGEAKWRLGTMTWGAMPGADPESTATQTPSQIWGQYGFGYRGSEGDPRDGAKVGRLAVSTGRDLFAGTGWSWDYDAGVRLAEATPGRGSLRGTPEAGDPAFRYRYGKADELQQIVDEASGQVAGIETGAYGRITSRNGIPFSYDDAGRRTEDDRFHYKWSWRGELTEVTVKSTWPSNLQSDYADHQIRYRYDAQGRLTTRSHFSPPVGNGGTRNLLEKRAYVWEGQSLLVEAAYADEAETQLQWRKTYVPGPSGLDDAVQVKVESFAGPGIAGTRLYTYIRDELGTVIGIVGEEENNDPAKPAIPARYLYSPYGEAHLEKGLEIRRVRFEEAEKRLGSQTQTLEDPDHQSQGALIVTFAAALDVSSLAGGVVVERYDGSEWLQLPPQDLLIGYEDSLELKILVRQGWARGTSYRVRLTGVKDQQGRGLAKAETFTWKIAARGTSSDFSKDFAVRYETAKAAVDTLGGRFPGGQNSLFQGLWADPVTGISYARARWYDGRNAGWLSEDPLLDVDSWNRYAFVGWRPSSAIDPTGHRMLTAQDEEQLAGLQARIDRFDQVYEARGIAAATLIEIVEPGSVDEKKAGTSFRSYLANDHASYLKIRAQLVADKVSFYNAALEADSDGGEIEYGITKWGSGFVTITNSEKRQEFIRSRLDFWTIDAPDLILSLVAPTPRFVSPIRMRGRVKRMSHGSGPAPGVLEVSSRHASVKAFRNYSPRKGSVEFVFDPILKRFAVGQPPPGRKSPHQRLAALIEANEDAVLGGMMSRGKNGEICTSENSGHYGERWDAQNRKIFVDFIGAATGQKVRHDLWEP